MKVMLRMLDGHNVTVDNGDDHPSIGVKELITCARSQFGERNPHLVSGW